MPMKIAYCLTFFIHRKFQINLMLDLKYFFLFSHKRLTLPIFSCNLCPINTSYYFTPSCEPQKWYPALCFPCRASRISLCWVWAGHYEKGKWDGERVWQPCWLLSTSSLPQNLEFGIRALTFWHTCQTELWETSVLFSLICKVIMLNLKFIQDFCLPLPPFLSEPPESFLKYWSLGM